MQGIKRNYLPIFKDFPFFSDVFLKSHFKPVIPDCQNFSSNFRICFEGPYQAGQHTPTHHIIQQATSNEEIKKQVRVK